MKKLLLTSGGFARNQTLYEKFIELVDKEPRDIRMLLVSAYPFVEATDDTGFSPETVFARERKALLERGFLPENLVNHCLRDKWKQNIEDFNAIYVNGGDCKLYAKGIAKRKFRTQIDALVNSGGVYAGISAGSFLAMSFGPKLLCYADCEFDVHSKNRYPAGPVDPSKRDVIALANDQALVVVNDEYTVIGGGDAS